MLSLANMTRRHFGKWTSEIAMFFGLLLSYGTFGVLAGRGLYPGNCELKLINRILPRPEHKWFEENTSKLPWYKVDHLKGGDFVCN